MMPSNHRLFLEAFDRLPSSGLPRPFVQELDRFTTQLLLACKWRSPTRTNFVSQHGAQLKKYCKHVLAELASNVGLAVSSLCKSHWDEVIRIFETFLHEAGQDPCMLWSHSVCWTDRAISRQFFGSDLRRVYRPRIKRMIPGSKVRLFFEANRYVSVNTAAIRWSLPAENKIRYQLVKNVESQEALQSGQITSMGHRETLGACIDTHEDRNWINNSLFPSLKGHVYSISKDENGFLSAELSTNENGLSDIQAQTRIIDVQGILNVRILKAWRIRQANVLPGVVETMADELTFAFHPTGEIVYIAATWDRLSRHIPVQTKVSWMEDWLGH